MKLKYYFRGIGIGVFATTVIFMILISVHRNDGTQGGTSAVVPDTESKTVAQVQKDTQKSSEEKDTKTQTGDKKDPKDTDAAKTDGKKTDAAKTDPAKDNAALVNPAKDDTSVKTPESEKKPDTKPQPEANASEQKSSEQPQPDVPKEEKVRIEISGGQYSDVVCKKLAEAGLVDDAKAFNDYLVQKDYDNAILPGVYEIPKGATYEEIAVLLTTKVR